ncbi:MAG: c-type cytochrome [Solirubrobacterales bacterium]|nr:c-type cytochrome [Solirubrobacterales bacterium]
MPTLSPRALRILVALILGLVALVAFSGCAVKHQSSNLEAGKVLFSKKCGSCHTLSHANTTGQTGPNLDDMFRQDRSDGIKDTSIAGLVSFWIQHPNTQGVMPAGLYTGQAAQQVASYVGAVAGRPGQDTGALAAAGGVQGTTPAAGKQVFTGVGGCGSCHTLADAGTNATVGPNLNQDLRANCASAQSKQVRGATLAECIEHAIVKPYDYIPAGYKAGVMPSNFGQSLQKNEITALVNYLVKATG